jgi:predicted nucleotidyltransferase
MSPRVIRTFTLKGLPWITRLNQKVRELSPMLKKSSPFVKISYFDEKAVCQALKLFLAELEGKHPEVEKVVIFGSFTKGQCVPGSDVDLLLILTESTIPLLERIPRYMPSAFPVPVDVFPYTKAEVARMLGEGNPFIKRAVEEGKVITGGDF